MAPCQKREDVKHISHEYPPPGHIGQLAHSGKTLGKYATFSRFGLPCGPRGSLLFLLFAGRSEKLPGPMSDVMVVNDISLNRKQHPIIPVSFPTNQLLS